MIKNKTFINFIMVTLMVSFLTFSVGKVTPVYALAELAPEVAPVFDTQIYQFQDYVEELTEPQYDIFCILLGSYVVLQAGAARYQLDSPDLTTEEGVFGWFKECGIQLYNSIIGFTPDTIRDPITGNIMSTTRIKELITTLVAVAMGDAVVAANYDTLEEFKRDFENSETFKVPFTSPLQIGLNSVFAISDGLFYWQFNYNPFESNVVWETAVMSQAAQSEYNYYRNQYAGPWVRTNHGDDPWVNGMFCLQSMAEYNSIFVNTSTGQWFFTNGINVISENVNNIISLEYNSRNASVSSYPYITFATSWLQGTLDFTLETWTQRVQKLFDTYPYFILSDFIDSVYYGPTLLDAQLLENITDLDFAQNDNPYYYQVVPDYNVDLKGFIETLLNELDLYKAFINNLFTVEGVLVTDPQLLKVSIEILDTLNELNPPLPVNLNDIATYTDNTYLERVKEHARNAGDIFANYVAFWHNCDSDLVYTVFGAAILVLIGAFIGKWGHSW